MTRIALVEDNPRLAQFVRKALGAAGIESDLFCGIETAWTAAQQPGYGLFVIDRGLPDGDGLLLVKRLRSASIKCPCMILTARDALHDRVQGLDSGADDYLAKPFSMEELVVRVRALLRRPATLQSLRPRFGDVEIRPQGGTMICGADAVTLAPAELQIMLSLVNANGDTVRRTGLEAAAWGLVRDEGPGIAEADLPHLFTRFWRGTSRLTEGAGLGLAICKEIVTAHHWHLSARNSGLGTEFVLRLGDP